MKHTAEVTTALAYIASRLASSKDFQQIRKISQKDAENFLLISSIPLAHLFGIDEEFQEEFALRYASEIMYPWCAED